MHDSSTYGALPVQTTLSELDHISKSHDYETVLTENIYGLSPIK